MPYPGSGDRASVRGVPVILGDRRSMGDSRTTASATRQHHRQRWSTRKTLPPSGTRCDLLCRSRWDRLAAVAGGVPARDHGVRDLRPLGPRRSVAADPRRAARSGRGSRAAATRCRPRRSSTPNRCRAPTPCPGRAADTTRGRRQRPQTAHRGGHQRPAAGGRGDHGRDSGPRRRVPAAGRAACPSSPPSAWSGPTAATPDG